MKKSEIKCAIEAILFANGTPVQLDTLSKALEIKQKYGKEIIFLQAMPSPVKRIQNKFRYQILTRYIPNDKITCDFFSISDIIEKDVSIFVEINPNNLR